MNNELEEVKEQYYSYIEKIPQGADYIVNNLREDNLEKALLTINDFAEGIMWLITMADILSTDIVNVNKIKEYLLEINEGLELQDFVLVADLFEYEIKPYFEGVLNS